MPAVSRLALGANLGRRLGPGFFNGLLASLTGFAEWPTIGGIHGSGGSCRPLLAGDRGQSEEGMVEYTDQQRAAFRDAYAKRRRNQLIVTVPLVAVIAAFAFTEDRGGGTALGLPPQLAGPIVILVVAAVLIFSFRNWRCPACNKYLGRSTNPKYCQRCGIELRA
jgi:hypothetical protein